jgi:hypothetical protein
MMGQFVMVMLYLWILFVILLMLVITWKNKK